MRMRMVTSAIVIAALFGSTAGSAHAKPVEDLKEILLKKDASDRVRVKAGVELGTKDPVVFASVLGTLRTEKREGDEKVLTKIAVMTQARQTRLLAVWAASVFGDLAVESFIDKIDNDHPKETIFACEALGFMKAGAAYDRLAELLRNQNDMIALAATRALSRCAPKAKAKDLAGLSLNVDSSIVRVHLVWAVQDIAGKKKTAMTAFSAYKSKKGSVGFRASEAVNILKDEMSPVQKYEEKLDTVKTVCVPKKGVKLPAIRGKADYTAPVKEALELMAKKAPDYYHLICVSIKVIEIKGEQWILKPKPKAVNLRLLDLVKWKDKKTGKIRRDLIEYYLVRYATILFLKEMGDPWEGQRGWEEGMIEGWRYAWAHTQIAVSEDLTTFLKAAIRKKPW